MVKNGEGLVLRIHHMNGVRWTWKGGGGGGGGGGEGGGGGVANKYKHWPN